MPQHEYEDEDIYYENELDDSKEDINRKNEDTFTKVQRRKKNKNKIEIGENEYIFASKCQGTYIVDATTGYKSSHRVGSLDENLFFSVIDSRAVDKIQEPLVFYFDSPEQCEHVFSKNFKNFKISQKTKENWHKKYLLEKNRKINKN